MKIYSITRDCSIYPALSFEQLRHFENNHVLSKKAFYEETLLNPDEEKAIVINPCCFDWNIQDEFLIKCKGLKRIYLSTTTNSCVNMELCNKLGIEVVTIPNKNTINEVATNLVFLMFALAKDLGRYMTRNTGKRHYGVSREEISLIGKNVGIVGLNDIGKCIAKFCVNNHMKVCYYDTRKTSEEYDFVALDRIFNCDVIFITEQENNKFKIDDKYLEYLIENHNNKHMKQILISACGNGVLNVDLAFKLLKNHKLFGLGIMNPYKPLETDEDEENSGEFSITHGNLILIDEYAWFSKLSKEKRDNILFDILLKDFPELKN